MNFNMKYYYDRSICLSVSVINQYIYLHFNHNDYTIFEECMEFIELSDNELTCLISINQNIFNYLDYKHDYKDE